MWPELNQNPMLLNLHSLFWIFENEFSNLKSKKFSIIREEVEYFLDKHSIPLEFYLIDNWSNDVVHSLFNKFFVLWNRLEEVMEKKNSASNTSVNWVTQSEHWKYNNRCQESDRAIKIIMASKEIDTTSTCCVVWENSLHLTRKSGRILSIEKWTHLMRVKFKENSDRPGSHRE